MKNEIKLITIIFLVVFFGCQSAKKMPVAIELDNLQVLYEKLENPITYVYKGLNCEDLLLVCDTTKAKIVKNDSCHFIITPYKAWQEGLDISVYKKTAHPKNLLETINLKTLSLPKPCALLVGKEGGAISTGALKVSNQLDVVLDGFIFEGIRYRATSFDCLIIDNDTKKVIENDHFEGRRFPKRLKEKLNYLKEGDIVYFYNIMAFSPVLGTAHLQNDITLWVK